MGTKRGIMNGKEERSKILGMRNGRDGGRYWGGEMGRDGGRWG